MPEGKLIYVRATDGMAIADIAIGINRSVVSVVDVEIEPGAEPVVLLLSGAHRLVWRLSGAVDRVAHVTLSAPPIMPERIAGITGLPSERVSFVKDVPCSHQLEKSDAARRLFGQGVQIVEGESIAKVVLPRGHIERTAKPVLDARLEKFAVAAPLTWGYLLELNPGGLVDLDPAKVIATAAVVELSPLPQEAGLAQLVAEGKIKEEGSKKAVVMPNGPTIIGANPEALMTVSSMKDVRIFELPKAYRVLQPIRLPEGLGGSHATRFIVAKGVPAPEGDPADSCVVSETTGEALLGSRCD